MTVKKKILVADDDKDFVEVLSERLVWAGYETISANEGVRVIAAAHSQKPDLILLDLMMPAGSGDMVLETLKARLETKSIPIIIMTGKTTGDVESKMRLAGADDFITKPYDSQELLRKIKDLL
jgi:CheY-like chemotaxis protein